MPKLNAFYSEGVQPDSWIICDVSLTSMSNIEINEAELKFIKCNISLLHWFLRAYISIVSSEDSSSCLVKNETRAGYFPLGFKPGVVHHAVAVRVCLLGFRQGVSRRIRTKVIPSTLYINILLLREIWFYLFYLFIYFYKKTLIS